MKITRLLAAATVLTCGLVSNALAGDTLTALLEMVAEASRIDAPLVGIGKADIDGVKGKVQDRVTILERAGADPKAPPHVAVAFETGKSRVLSLSPSQLQLSIDGKVKNAAPEEGVPPSSFSVEDLLPFEPERCAVIRIADLGDAQFTLICEPKKPPSQYAFMVFKFDREMAVPRQALLYKETSTNLVRMLRYDDFVKVGKNWMPKQIVLQDFKLRTRDELTLEWHADAKLAADVFDPKVFATAALPR
jgi:outer membrane lipoprotein-sorting protein